MRKRNIVLLGLTAAIATVAFVSGGAQAAADGMFGSNDIRDNSIRSNDVRDNTLQVADLNRNAVKALQGADGEDGTNGRDGKDGKDGTNAHVHPAAGAGYAGLGHHEYWQPGVVSETVQKCRAGEVVTGGGFSQEGGADDLGGSNDVQILVSAPYTGDYQPISQTDSRFHADRWIVRGINHGDAPVDVRAWVLCAVN